MEAAPLKRAFHENIPGDSLSLGEAKLAWVSHPILRLTGQGDRTGLSLSREGVGLLVPETKGHVVANPSLGGSHSHHMGRGQEDTRGPHMAGVGNWRPREGLGAASPGLPGKGRAEAHRALS